MSLSGAVLRAKRFLPAVKTVREDGVEVVEKRPLEILPPGVLGVLGNEPGRPIRCLGVIGFETILSLCRGVEGEAIVTFCFCTCWFSSGHNHCQPKYSI